MIRYTAHPRSLIDDMNFQRRFYRPDTPTVFESENNSRTTGILNARGDPIYAVHETEPIGFVPVKRDGA